MAICKAARQLLHQCTPHATAPTCIQGELWWACIWLLHRVHPVQVALAAGKHKQPAGGVGKHAIGRALAQAQLANLVSQLAVRAAHHHDPARHDSRSYTDLYLPEKEERTTVAVAVHRGCLAHLSSNPWPPPPAMYA